MGYLSFIDEELSHGIPALLKQLPPSPSQQGGEAPPQNHHRTNNNTSPSYSIMAVELSESAAEVDELVLEVQQWRKESNEIFPTAASSSVTPPTLYVTSSSDWDAFLGDLKTTSEQLWGTIAALPSNRRGPTTPSQQQQQQPLLQRSLGLLFNGAAGFVVDGGGDGHSAPTVEQWKATVGSLLLLLLNRWCDLVTLLGEVVAILVVVDQVGGEGGPRSSSPLTSIHKMDALMLVSIGALHTIEPFSHRNAQANIRRTESPCGDQESYQILRKMYNDGITSSSDNFDHTYGPLLSSMKSLFTECANVIASCFVDIGNFWLLSSPSPLVSALSSNRGGGGANSKSPSTGLVQACHNTVVVASSSAAEGGGGTFGFVSREGVLPNLGEVGGRSSGEPTVGIGAPFVVSGACQAPISVLGMAVNGGVSSRGDLDVEMLIVAMGALLSVTHSKAACYRVCTFDRTLEAFGVKSLALRHVQSQASQDSFVASPLGGSGGDEDAEEKFSKRSERCLMALSRLEQSVALLQSAIYGYISTKASIFVTTTIMPAVWGGDWEKHQNFLGGRAITHSIPYFFSYLASEILEKQIMMSRGSGDGTDSQFTSTKILTDAEKTIRRVLCDITASTYKRTFITHYTNHVLTTRCSFNRTKQLNADTLAVVRYTRWLRQLGVHNRANCPQQPQQHYLWAPPPRTAATVSKTAVEYFSHCATVDADSSVRDFFLLDLIPTEIHLPSAFSGDGSEAEMWEVQKLMVILAAIGLRSSDLEKLSTWRESQRRQFIDNNMQGTQHDSDRPSVIAVNEQGISSDLSKPPTPPSSAFSHQTPAENGGSAAAEEGGEEAPADDVEGFMNVFWTLPSAKSSLQQRSSSSSCGWSFDLVMDLHHSWAANSPPTAKKNKNQPPRILTPLTMKFTSGTAAEVKNWQLLPTGLSVATLSTTDAPGFGTTKIGSFFASSSEALRLGAYFGRACQHNANALSCFDLLLKEVEMLCTKASPSSPHHHSSTPSTSKHQIPMPLLSAPAIHTLTHLPLVNLLCVADVAGIPHDLLPGTSLHDSQQQQQQLDDTVDGNQNTISSALSVSFGVLSCGGGGSTISGQHGGSSSNLTSPRGGGGASSPDASLWKLVDKVVTLRYEFWDVYPALTEEQLASRNHYLKVSK